MMTLTYPLQKDPKNACPLHFGFNAAAFKNELLKMVRGSKSTYYITCTANSTQRVTGVPYV